MTLKEFLKEYKRLFVGNSEAWLELQCIRDSVTGACPVVLVANAAGGRFNNGQITQAADFLGLSRVDTLDIQMAADGHGGRGMDGMRELLSSIGELSDDNIDTYLSLR